ncbi:MAG: chemotaxis protein CheA [Desulfatitalea sp.]|nr:chemotaxis protein CheA [Desulfatitalea sp.]
MSQATEQHNNGQSVDWMLFADEVTWNNMRRVASFFPKIESVQALLVSAQAFIEQQASPGEDEPLVQVALGAFEATSVSERVSHGDTALMVDHAAAQYEAQAEIEDLTSRLAAITEATEAYTQVDTESFDGTQTADIDQEQSLLLRLENAFDANLVGLADSSLLSEEEIELFKGMLSEGTEIPDEPVSWSTDREIESWLFSDGKLEDAPWQSMLLPKPLDKPGKKSSQEGLRSIGDEQHPSQIYPGRRQTDTTRERLIKQSIRVEAGKIDMLMNKVGELVVMRAGFSQMLEEMRELQLMLKQRQRLDIKEMQPVKKLTHRLNEATVSLSRVAAELQENVMKMRMLPITHLFSRYPRVVHELVRNISKQVTLETHGEKTELDRMVIEQISDPLVHIIRNAVDHGIEEIEERRRNGKPESGTVHLDAYHEGNSVVIEISDDGRGIDPEMIKAKAIQDGFVQPEELSAMSTEEILEIIMRPGFSTSEEVTHTSGRGVGMDVVKDNIERLNGTIKIESTPGIRTMIRIRIPLTLAIIQALMVRVSGVQFSIPLSAVDETIRIGTADVFTLEDMEVYDLRETNLPLIRLARIFKIADTQTDAKEHFIVVVRTGNRQVGLIVDQLQGKEDVVIKPLEDYLQEKSGFCGATILGDGSISLILDVAEVFHMSMLQNKC